MDVTEENPVQGDEKASPHKKRRHRKKRLYSSILQQMEFYFSDSNLAKDRFLSQLIKSDPYVPLDLFLTFNKIRQLTSNVEDIQKAIKNSSLIKLSEDKNSVCRVSPIRHKDDVDECTIYVEQLKSDATHEWLTSVFSEFGKVVYVSIPKYKHKNTIKGFAFVEFDNQEGAENTLQYFKSIGCKMPSHVEPSELCSISTFEGNIHIDNKETPNDITETIPENNCNNICSKRKLEQVEDSEIRSEESIKRPKIETMVECDTETKIKKKLKKEHKKMNTIKELGLQILSKREWKQMRNKYLDLQRKKMKEFKKHLHKSHFSQPQDNTFKKPESHTEHQKGVIKADENDKLNFVQGTIAKIELTEQLNDMKKFKNDLKSTYSNIKYVDIPNPGSTVIYVRFGEHKNALEFCDQKEYGKKYILTGKEEEDYWDKLRQQRQEKFRKTSKCVRGRDKLLRKAKHIKFDD